MNRSSCLSAGVSALAGVAVYELVLRPFFSKYLKKEDDVKGGSSIVKKELPESMISEMLSRHEAFFGKEGNDCIRGSRVLVIGLGGVGSHLATMLGRAGVKVLRLVDFDMVTLSSLNRHAVAGLSDVGIPKTACVKRFIEAAAPFVHVESLPIMFNANTQEQVLTSDIDLVFDCIDDVDTKAILVEACVKKGLRIICAMGAGAKADPTRFCVSPLADAVQDPLAAKLRWKLRGRGLDYGGQEDPKDGVIADPFRVVCVYSYEAPRCGLLPLTEDQEAEGANNFGALTNFRLRVLPVLGATPAFMGQAMAAVGLCRLARQPVSPAPREPLSQKAKRKMMQDIQKREARRELGPKATTEQCDWLDCLSTEIEYVVTEVWRARCAVTNRKLERKPLALSRWYTSVRPFSSTPADQRAALPLVAADELILLAPHLAERLDAALNAAASSSSSLSHHKKKADLDALLFQAAASALGGEDAVRRIDARLKYMRDIITGYSSKK